MNLKINFELKRRWARFFRSSCLEEDGLDLKLGASGQLVGRDAGSRRAVFAHIEILSVHFVDLYKVSHVIKEDHCLDGVFHFEAISFSDYLKVQEGAVSLLCWVLRNEFARFRASPRLASRVKPGADRGLDFFAISVGTRRL